jgi:putative copper resistance protein D
MTALLALTRGLHDASVMALFGSACLLALLVAKIPGLAFEDQSLVLGRRAASLAALASAPVWLAGQTLPQMVHAPAGAFLMARLLLLLFLVVAVWMGRTRTSAWLAGAALVAIAATGHAAAASPQGFWAIGAVNNGLHLLTAAYWIGGLCVLLAMLAMRPSAPRLPQAVTLFAEWGMIAVALLVMTGIINAAMVLLGSPGRDNSAYLTVLGLKLVLALVMITLAAINHFRFLPRLGQQKAVARLKNRTGWELVLGLVVVGLAALLTLLPPTHQ